MTHHPVATRFLLRGARHGRNLVGGSVSSQPTWLSISSSSSSSSWSRCHSTPLSAITTTPTSTAAAYSLSSHHYFSSQTNHNDPPKEDVVWVSIDQAQSTTALALQQIGWDQHDAALQAEIMTAAELCGNNQGLVKMYDPTMANPPWNELQPILRLSMPIKHRACWVPSRPPIKLSLCCNRIPHWPLPLSHGTCL
jgi:hypothetical protein